MRRQSFLSRRNGKCVGPGVRKNHPKLRPKAVWLLPQYEEIDGKDEFKQGEGLDSAGLLVYSVDWL